MYPSLRISKPSERINLPSLFNRQCLSSPRRMIIFWWIKMVLLTGITFVAFFSILLTIYSHSIPNPWKVFDPNKRSTYRKLYPFIQSNRNESTAIIRDYQIMKGRGYCGRYQLPLTNTIGSLTFLELLHLCKQTHGCTHVTRNQQTGQSILCSSFEDFRKTNDEENNWLTAVNIGCPIWAPLWPSFVYDPVDEAPFCPIKPDTCPSTLHTVMEPRPGKSVECDVCPGKGCIVPDNFQHFDTLALPARKFAKSIALDMEAFNPVTFQYYDKLYVALRITNQTRCTLKVRNPDPPEGSHYTSFVGICPLSSVSYTISSNDCWLLDTTDVLSMDSLPFRGLEDCRFTLLDNQPTFYCSVYLRLEVEPEKYIESTRIAIGYVNNDLTKVTRLQILRQRYTLRKNPSLPSKDPNLERLMQKNWMIVPPDTGKLINEIVFIANVFPLVTATCSLSNSQCILTPHAVDEPIHAFWNSNLGQWRGGSALVETDLGYLAILHVRKHIARVAMYSHALALFRKEFPHNLVAISEPFRLPRSRTNLLQYTGIQFGLSLQYDPLTQSAILGYGDGDCTAELVRVNRVFDQLAWQEISTPPPFRSMVSLLRRNTDPLALLPEKDLVRIVGPVTSTFSIAVVNRFLASAILRAGYRVTLRHSSWGEKTEILRHHPVFNYLQPFVEISQEHASRRAAVTIYNDWPPQLHPPLTGKWVWNLAWEFTSIPLTWRDVILESTVDMWVPSTFVKNVLMNAGIPSHRITLIPHAISCPYTEEIVDSESKIKDVTISIVDDAYHRCATGDFIYVFHGGALWRKGLDVLLDVFMNNEDEGLQRTCLIVHSMYGTDDVQKMVREAEEKFTKQHQRRLVIITKELSDMGVSHLFSKADAFIHPSRGEGFGLVAAEALACGIPLIATTYGATTDFATSETAFLIDGKLVPCNKPPCSTDGTLLDLEMTEPPLWFEPDPESLVRTMIQIKTETNERERRRKNGIELMANQFSVQELNYLVDEYFRSIK